ncbi:MAG: PTS IIA-like nitrogen regulatory protein PtsN [Gammaproteobacteria bacterium]|nr:PTS IIA-like nitrogen regulatory protein PtsN [Gammaproteobacteria bacterium]
MSLSSLLDQEHVASHVQSASKKRALEELSQLIVKGEPGLSQTEVFECLIARERLGSTGLGKGVAIPHGRLKSGEKVIAAFVQLADGVDFDSPDGQPVDLLCALMVPPDSTDEHLQTLAALSEMFRNEQLRDALRGANNDESLFQVLQEWLPKN